MPAIPFSGQLSTVELLRASRGQFVRERRRAYAVIVLFALAQLLLLDLSSLDARGAVYAALLVLITAAAGIALFRLLDRLILALMLRKYASLTAPVEGTIGEDGIRVNGTTTAWADVRRAWVVAGYAVLPGPPAYVLARGFFADAEAWDAATALVAAHTKARVRC